MAVKSYHEQKAELRVQRALELALGTVEDHGVKDPMVEIYANLVLEYIGEMYDAERADGLNLRPLAEILEEGHA